MTVSYRMSMTDTWQYLSYLSTKTITERFVLASFFIALVADPIVSYHTATLHHTAPAHHPASSAKFDHLLALVSVLAVVATCAMIFLWVLVVLYLGTLVTPKTTVTIDPECCRLKTFLNMKSPWKQFATIVEEPGYFYFVGWTRAFSVPKRAFNSSAEAYAFFDLASDYWRKAKGIAPPSLPNTSGVWPPAPTPD